MVRPIETNVPTTIIIINKDGEQIANIQANGGIKGGISTDYAKTKTQVDEISMCNTVYIEV